jgi:hypothetical protein
MACCGEVRAVDGFFLVPRGCFWWPTTTELLVLMGSTTLSS